MALTIAQSASAVGSQGAVEIALPALDLQKIALDDEAARFKLGAPTRFAIPQDVDFVPGKQGGWIDDKHGRSTWRVRVSSPDTAHLNFGFTRFHLPSSATLVIESNDKQNRLGPFGEKDNPPTGELWTQVLPGSGAIIELVVDTAQRSQVDLRLSRIGQGYRGFGAGNKFCKSGNCNMDVACLANDDPWNEPRRAVAAITVGATDTCTGSLMNNTSGNRRLLFATASHCNITSANVASVLAYFNYESPTCRTPTASGSSPVLPKPASTLAGLAFVAATQSPFGGGSGPATLRSDWTLIELATSPNQASYNLFWAGWDRGDPPTTCTPPGSPSSTSGLCASIHHPGVDEKRITFVEEAMTIDGISGGTSTHWRANWDTTPPIVANLPSPQPATLPPGVTEPGSSGSPLYNANRRMVGVLSGGPSACGATGVSLRDQYGGLFNSWEGAGTAATRMRDALDPGGSNPTFIDGVGQCTRPETPINVATAATAPNQITVSWNAAPGVESYDVLRSDGACPGGNFVLVANDVTGTSFNDTQVSGTSTYSYKVVSYDQQENCESVQSACSSATATGACTLSPSFAGLATATSANQAACSINLGWNAASPRCAGPATYNLYRSTTPAFTPSVANRIATGVSATTFNDAAVEYNVPYFYRARAVDSSNGLEEGNSVERTGTARGLVSPGNLTETFEIAGGFDNPGWTHRAITGANVWAWSTAQSQTPTHSWFSSSQTSTADRELVSPEFGALANTTLSFFHTFAFEGSIAQCYDAGTLEISTNGGTSWSVVPDAAFTAGLFNGSVVSTSNPLRGKRAWCSGTLGTMTQVSVDLGAFAGQNVRVRWHAGDDVSIAVTGWFVDSVTVSNAGTAGICTSGAGDLVFGNGFE